MALTRSELRDLISENIHNDSSISNARLNSWINLAQDEVEQAVLNRYLRAKSNILTTADVNEYVLIERYFRAFIQFWQLDTPTKMSFVPYSEFIRINPDPTQTSSGKPLRWSFLGFTSGFPAVLFDPTPDDAYVISYEFCENLPDLTADSDTSLISQLGWDELLLTGATKQYYRIHSQNDYQIWEQKFQLALREFKTEFRQMVNQGKTLVDILAEGEIRSRSLFRLPPEYPVL